jgi:hypothetical protein
MANLQNLKPFTGIDDPRRQNGRPKGSKNLATVVRELENEDFDWSKIPSKRKNLSGSPWQAIVYTAIAKALKGDIRAMEWLRQSGYDNKLVVEHQETYFRPPVVISSHDPKLQTEEEKRAIAEEKRIHEEIFERTGSYPISMHEIKPRYNQDLEANS